MDIIKEIKKLMIDRDISQYELSKSLSFTQQKLNYIFNLKRKAKIQDIESILEVLGSELKIVEKK